MKQVLIGMGVMSLVGCVAFNEVEIPIKSKINEFEEKTVLAEPGADGKVALIDLDGVISDESNDSLWSHTDSPVVAFIEKLKKAESDRSVKAILVRLNTPGGEVTASDILYNELRAVKARRKIPVVAACLGVCASGGYYIASACDRIVVHPTTITGSIGVIALHVSLSGLLGKIGVKVEAFKSGTHKDTGSPFRDLTDEDRRILQALIDQMYNRFVGIVREGRRGMLTPDQVRTLADGRIYTAPQALEAKLVDRVGYLQDALDEAKSLAGLTAAELVMYSRKPEVAENAYSPTPSAESFASGDLGGIRKLLGLRLYYLWDPYLLGR